MGALPNLEQSEEIIAPPPGYQRQMDGVISDDGDMNRVETNDDAKMGCVHKREDSHALVILVKSMVVVDVWGLDTRRKGMPMRMKLVVGCNVAV
jgi:hypothetical protein